MALMLLRVFLLGVVAAAADDVSVTWRSGSRASLPCVPPSADRLQPRGPPPPLEGEEQPDTSPYSWRRLDGEPIGSKRISPSGALEVSRRKGGDGVYQCLVRHGGGLVLGYPTHLKFASMEKHFSSDQEEWKAWSGQPFALSCDIGSAPPADVSWLRDDQPVPDDDRYHHLQSQLLITDVTISDAGLYRCIATNPQVNKNKTSQPSWLEVQPSEGTKEPAFLPLRVDRNITVPRGSRVVLPCPVSGWPRPRLIWELTPPGGTWNNELDVEAEVFIIHSLQSDNEGLYTCTVARYPHLAKVFNVTLTEPVRISIPPTSKEAHLASTVRFNCTAEGRPAPAVTWYKNGEPLTIAGSVILRNSTDKKRTELVISGVTSSDAGVYQCFAQNAASTESAWAVLQVTGVYAEAPTNVRCWPVGDHQVKVTWEKPAVGKVVAYTVHNTLDEEKTEKPLPGNPVLFTEEIVSVTIPLTPYRFLVRAYGAVKNAVSDYSNATVCQGQGVPITLSLSKPDDDSVLVSWKQFAEETPGVAQWVLQYRPEGTNDTRNLTFDSSVYNYTFHAISASPPLKVRVLGSRNATWLPQDLSLVPWRNTADASRDSDIGEVTAIPQDIELARLGARVVSVTWRCDDDDKYSFTVCARSNGIDKCQQSKETSATFEELQPATEYEIRVQARLEHLALGGPFSAPYTIVTSNDSASSSKELSGQFINSTTLKVTWTGPPGKYTVHYSNELELPVGQWASVETMSNTVLISGIDPTKTTYLMVNGHGPTETSRVETIQPLIKDPNANELKYTLTDRGIEVRWQGGGPREIKYSQNLTWPMGKWNRLVRNKPPAVLTNLDPTLPTFVLVTSSDDRHSPVLTIQPRTPAGGVHPLPPPNSNPLPPPNSHPLPSSNSSSSNLSLPLGIAVGVICIVGIIALAAVCIWRKHKRMRSPGRSRRRNAAANDDNPEEAEMKSLEGRLANGGARGAGEPLLNGHVHITENPSSKTPNGKLKKGHRFEEAFDVSRPEPAPAAAYTLLDTSRPDLDLSRPPLPLPLPSNPSFAKLPDDNMNSELTRSSFQLDNSKIQPTLQPNG